MTTYETTKTRLIADPKNWLVTGAAGFIGSHIVETLLRLNQKVVAIDNFSTGRQQNLAEVKELVRSATKFTFIEGDIRNLKLCQRACRGVDYVLHQAGLGSVPRSIDNPINTNETNITGHLKMLVAARDQGVKRFVYAASSSTYGDHAALPKVEDRIGRPLSPYAVTKYVNELYADVFGRCYGLDTVGLRYFNVFGPRQDPNGAYAAVIPKWITAMINRQPIYINGDGETSRDFCYVANAIQANLLAATSAAPGAVNQVYNVAVNGRTTLKELFSLLRELLIDDPNEIAQYQPSYRDFRPGDVLHSRADIGKASRLLGYAPSHHIREGLQEALPWYKQAAKRNSSSSSNADSAKDPQLLSAT